MERKNNLVSGTSETAVRDCGIKHLVLMLICCLVPLAAALTLKMLGYAGVASYLVLLLCPLMHLVMMKDMFVKKPCSTTNKNTPKEREIGG